MKAKLRKLAGRVRAKGRPVWAIRMVGRRTPIVVGARDGVFSKAEAIKLAFERKKEGGNRVAAAWRLKGDSLARANRGEWIKDYGPDGRPAPRNIKGFGPPLKGA